MATPRKTAAPKPADQKVDPPKVDIEKEKTEADLKREAYSAAQTQLRKAHYEEFKALVVAAAKERGVEYTFAPTAEEKAAALLKETLEKYPHLRDQLVGQQADSQPVPETVS